MNKPKIDATITINQPDKIRARMGEIEQEYNDMAEKPSMSEGFKGALVGRLNLVLREVDSDGKEATATVFDPKQERYVPLLDSTGKPVKRAEARRRMVVGFLFCKDSEPYHDISTHTLSDGQWYALKRWIGMKGDVDQAGKTIWTTRAAFETEANLIATWALFMRGITDQKRNSLTKTQPYTFKDIYPSLIQLMRGEVDEISQGGALAAGMRAGGIVTGQLNELDVLGITLTEATNGTSIPTKKSKPNQPGLGLDLGYE